MPVHPAQSASTRDQLLDAAERLFAERGVRGASVREITTAARANLAAVNYHFGSKEGLVRAVLARRIEPLNHDRLERLERLGPAPEIEPIVRAFVAPALRMIETESGGHDFARFVVRTMTDPGPDIREAVFDQFGRVIERFTEALGRALPALDDEELAWRFFFMAGALAHTVSLGPVARRLSGGCCDPSDVERLISSLVAFVVAGLSAEPPRGAEGAR